MATTTNYGWTTPNDTDLVKNGASAIRTLGSGVDTTLGTALNNKLHAGLVLVKTQTIGTGVTSVTVTNAFSATYDNYKIVVSGGTSSADENMNLQLGPSSVSGYNTGYYSSLVYANFSTGTVTNAPTSNGSFFAGVGFTFTGAGYFIDCDILGPRLTNRTALVGPRTGLSTSANVGSLNAFHQSSSSFTDFTILPGSGTLTGGTIAVYGYAKD